MAMSNTSPPSCHRASFPKGKIWSNKTWVWHLVGTFGHLAHIRICWKAQPCQQCTDIPCTAHTVHLSLSTSSGFAVLDRLFMGMGWDDMSQKHCTHGTCVDHVAVRYGPSPSLDQGLCLIKRNFAPWHTPASLCCRGDTNRTVRATNWTDINSEYQDRETFTAGVQNKVSLMEDKDTEYFLSKLEQAARWKKTHGIFRFLDFRFWASTKHSKFML